MNGRWQSSSRWRCAPTDHHGPGRTDVRPGPSLTPNTTTQKRGTRKIQPFDVDPGDRIVLPGDAEPSTAVHVWYRGDQGRWAIQVEGDAVPDDARSFSVIVPPEITLIERPGYGPFDHEYTIGDSVFYRWAQHDNLFGVVLSVTIDPDDTDCRVYEIQSANGIGYAAQASMRPAEQPRYAVGQRWRCDGKCASSGRTGTIVEVDEAGLICTLRMDDTGSVGRYVLTSPAWKLVQDPSA